MRDQEKGTTKRDQAPRHLEIEDLDTRGDEVTGGSTYTGGTSVEEFCDDKEKIEKQ